MAQCKAHRRAGTQCKNPAILGGTVCRYHGGSAPQVKAKAAERLAALVNPAIDKLTKLLTSKTEAVALGAVKDVLDRTGHKAADRSVIQTVESDEAQMLSEIFTPDELIRIQERVNARQT